MRCPESNVVQRVKGHALSQIPARANNSDDLIGDPVVAKPGVPGLVLHVARVGMPGST
jgi:hypothetical protein